MGHRRRGMETNCVSYNKHRGDAWTKSMSPIITHKRDACLQNESVIRTYKGGTGIQAVSPISKT